MRDNPIWYREARAWRKPHRWLSLLLYPALLVAPSLLALAGPNAGPHYASERALSQAFMLTCFGHLLYMCVRSLLSTVTLVAAERERGTFDALTTTRTSVREIVGVTLGWAMFPRLVELLLFGPLLFLLPGAGRPDQTAAVLLMTVPLIAAYAAFGLWLSAGHRRSSAAVAWGLGVLVANFFGLLVIEVVVGELARSSGPWLCYFIDPLVACIDLFENSGWRWLLCPGFHALAAAGWLALVVRKLSRPEGERTRRAGTRRWLLPGLSEDPILYRELLQSSRSGLAWLLAYPLLIAGPAVLVMLLSPSRDLSSRYAELLLALSLHAVYMAIRTISAGTRAVGLEREQGTWEPLLSTRLTGTQLLRGKLLAGLLPSLAPLLVFGPVWTLYLQADQALGILVYSALLGLFLYSLALWLTLRGWRAAPVGALVSGLLAAVTFGTIAVEMLISRQSFGVLSQLSPVFATACFIEEPQSLRLLLAVGPYALGTVLLLGGCYVRLTRLALLPRAARSAA